MREEDPPSVTRTCPSDTNVRSPMYRPTTSPEGGKRTRLWPTQIKWTPLSRAQSGSALLSAAEPSRECVYTFTSGIAITEIRYMRCAYHRSATRGKPEGEHYGAQDRRRLTRRWLSPDLRSAYESRLDTTNFGRRCRSHTQMPHQPRSRTRACRTWKDPDRIGNTRDLTVLSCLTTPRTRDLMTSETP